MKKLALGGLLAVVVAGGSAIAADLPYRAPAPVYKAPPPQIFTWTGCYIGGHVGWMKNDSDLRAYPNAAFPAAQIAGSTYGYSFNESDLTAGVQYGCNKQVGQWVFGLDSSLSWSRRYNALIRPGASPSRRSCAAISTRR